MKLKAPVLLFALLASLPSRADVISSIERLDSTNLPNVLFHSPESFRPGFPIWSDYTFLFQSAPLYLRGADQVRTTFSADSIDPDFQLRLTLAVPATVYLFIDDRAPNVATAMPWVSALGFTDTGDEAVLQISGDMMLTTASIYSGSFPAGDLILLQQNDPVIGHSAMYTVAAVPEPASLSLLLASAALCFRRRR